jgi:hypothetical protein
VFLIDERKEGCVAFICYKDQVEYLKRDLGCRVEQMPPSGRSIHERVNILGTIGFIYQCFYKQKERGILLTDECIGMLGLTIERVHRFLAK